MKRLLSFVLTALAAAAISASAQVPQVANVALSGVSLLTGVSAAATASSGAVKLPVFSGAGVLTITESGITGSPSGCTLALAYQSNNAATATSAVSTTSFTPSTGVQQFNISPNVLAGDAYVATYACSSTYPTAGLLTVSFSPVATASLDPCLIGAKSIVSVAISTATTTQLVAPVTGQSVYACGFTATVGATTTLQFEYGTSTSCTGTHALTGVMAPATGAVLSLSAEGTRLSAPTSNGICIVSTGTGGINGLLSYVQQ